MAESKVQNTGAQGAEQAPIGKRYTEVPVKSAIPFWVAAAVWVIFAMFLPFYRIWHFILCAAISFFAGWLTKRLLPKEYKRVEVPVATGSVDADAAVKELDRVIATLEADKTIALEYSENETAMKMQRIIAAAEKIRDDILVRPDDVKHVRRFLNYYMPTTVKLTNQYSFLLRSARGGANYNETKAAIESALGTVGATFDHQYDALFADDALDITTDIKVMETMIKKNNL